MVAKISGSRFEPHRALIEHPEDFIWRIEKVWSCSYHDHDIHEYQDPDGESDEFWGAETCLGCLAGGWKTKFDEDGSFYLTFSERSIADKILITYYTPIITEQLNQLPLLLCDTLLNDPLGNDA